MRRRAELTLSVMVLAVFCSGCFAVRALRGDPEKYRPDPGLSELVIPTNSILATNAPAIR